MSEFYVGYLPQSPPGIRRRVRVFVFTILMLSIAGAVLFAASQKQFANSTFEFGNVRDFRGYLQERPYPTLTVADTPTTEQAQSYFLVAPSKHGAESLLQSFPEQSIRLKGTLISRREGQMIEVVPGSIVAEGRGNSLTQPIFDLGERSLEGEIVDTKCFLGVMNPGESKVHRDCAALCLRGGIPPALYTRDFDGSSKILLLTDASGVPLPKEAYLHRVGQPVQVGGHAFKSSGLYYIRTSAENINPLP
jgi:hypothetical protein